MSRQRRCAAILQCISRGIDTGLIAPWCAVNFGDSKLAPKRKYIVPNDEAQEVTDDYAKTQRCFLQGARRRQAGRTSPYACVDITMLATDYRVRVPELASAPTAAPVPGAPPPSP